MGVVADRTANLTIRVVSPDNQIRATMVGREDVTVAFRPGTYRKFTKDKLESQLGPTTTLLSTGWQRGYGQSMDEAGVTRVKNPAEATTRAQKTFLESSPRVTAVGRTDKRLVRIKTVGMMNWEVRIADE